MSKETCCMKAHPVGNIPNNTLLYRRSTSGFTATDTMQGGAFSTTAQVPVLRLYRFLTTFTVQSGPDKGKPLLDGNAVSDRDFLRAVMRADYSTIYGSCVKGKMRCVAILLSKAYFKDWKVAGHPQPVPWG